MSDHNDLSQVRAMLTEFGQDVFLRMVANAIGDDDVDVAGAIWRLTDNKEAGKQISERAGRK